MRDKINVGDTVDLLDPQPRTMGREQLKAISGIAFPIVVRKVNRGWPMIGHVSFAPDRFVKVDRRVDPPTSEVDEVDKPEIIELVGGQALWLSESNRIVSELRRQLAEANATLGAAHDAYHQSDDEVRELREQLSTVTRERDELRRSIDDPELDCTDAAHPAWWRGHDHTAKVFCQLVNEILDGKDVSHGISGEPWQATKMRVADLRTKLATAEADLQAIAKAVEPNYSNDMRLVDEIIIAIGNLQQAVKCSDEACAKAESDSAAMLRTMTENESRLKDVIRRIGVSTTTGWITHELNHVLLDIPSGTAGRELLDRHKQEIAEKDAEIGHIETCKEETARLWKREMKKCRTAKAALVEMYCGKIDPAWFGDESASYKYRTTANPSGVIWRTSDGQSCEASMAGHAWITATAYSSWQECCDDKRTYPCHADGTPLGKSDDDAALLRKLREWIKNGVFTVVGNSVSIGCQCVPTGLAELLIAIRDGGAA